MNPTAPAPPKRMIRSRTTATTAPVCDSPPLSVPEEGGEKVEGDSTRREKKRQTKERKREGRKRERGGGGEREREGGGERGGGERERVRVTCS
jgi:hypothetical protein